MSIFIAILVFSKRLGFTSLTSILLEISTTKSKSKASLLKFICRSPHEGFSKENDKSKSVTERKIAAYNFTLGA